MHIAGADSLRRFVEYAKVNEIQRYLDKERELMQLAQVLEKRQASELSARDVQQLMEEMGYNVAHYLHTLQNWNTRYGAAARPWDAPGQELQPHPVVRRYAEAGFASRGRVLEVGCGVGANARFLASRGARVTAIDVALPAIEVARSRALSEGESCEFVCSNVFEFEHEAESFDALLDCWCFHHIPAHLMSAFAELVGRALRPRGELLLLCHSPHGCGPLTLTYGLAGELAKIVAYVLDSATESVLSRDEIRDVFSPYFDIGPIELHHDVHIRGRGHYSFVTLMKKKG